MLLRISGAHQTVCLAIQPIPHMASCVSMLLCAFFTLPTLAKLSSTPLCHLFASRFIDFPSHLPVSTCLVVLYFPPHRLMPMPSLYQASLATLKLNLGILFFPSLPLPLTVYIALSCITKYVGFHLPFTSAYIFASLYNVLLISRTNAGAFLPKYLRHSSLAIRQKQFFMPSTLLQTLNNQNDSFS